MARRCAGPSLPGVAGDARGAVAGGMGLDLADYLATGTVGVEHLVEEAKEGAADREDPFSAVRPLVGLG
jgi:hypothetical protein